VCVAPAPLPPDGGWVEVRCAACGTDFVASDGSPPPMIVPPVVPRLPVAEPSPLTPPPEAWEPLPEELRGATSDVYIDGDGRRFVVCPQCRAAEVDVPPDAWLMDTLRCPSCHKPFVVSLSGEPTPVETPGPPAPPPVFDPHRKLWSRCPNCDLASLTPARSARDRALVCTACGQRVIVSTGRRAPLLPLLPAPPTLWDRIRRWLSGD